MTLYAAPTIEEMASKIRRALRDDNEDVFKDALVVDFMNAGLAELSLIRPLEVSVYVTDEDGLAGLDTDPDALTVADLDSVYAVELLGIDGSRHDGAATLIGVNDPTTNWRNGWDFVGGTIDLPRSILDSITADWDSGDPSYRIRVWGYRHRRRIDDPNTDVLELYSLPEEQAVVYMAQKTGFETLMNDRALFQQWQNSTNATDISPNQLSQMAYGAQTNWERLRKRLQIIRRQPMGSQ